ncbi:head domain of trimeric autotransporter adhesin [Plakobranchus ocellatus]|uniref:Head domain of trimeric autotransporter adhesin n=1 Tax=Plakobranchus ocellatus TaxID=259542 RepID=A0AAV3ZTF2_9GAST|nr:head domain of trimeric autotransporter adhesin [Plakobranchus ocellatus]
MTTSLPPLILHLSTTSARSLSSMTTSLPPLILHLSTTSARSLSSMTTSLPLLILHLSTANVRYLSSVSSSSPSLILHLSTANARSLSSVSSGSPSLILHLSTANVRSLSSVSSGSPPLILNLSTTSARSLSSMTTSSPPLILHLSTANVRSLSSVSSSSPSLILHLSTANVRSLSSVSSGSPSLILHLSTANVRSLSSMSSGSPRDCTVYQPRLWYKRKITLFLPEMFAKPIAFMLVVSLGVFSQVQSATSEAVSSFEIFRPCKKYDVDGCSIPFGLPFFYKTQFTLSCDRHDICYHCGVAYGIPRARCDNAFHNNTLSTCRSNYLSLTPLPVTGTAFTRKESNKLRKLRFLEAVEEHGAESLELVLRKEIKAFMEKDALEPSVEEFLAWLSEHEVQVRMLAEWARILDGHFQQADPDSMRKGSIQNKMKLFTRMDETNGMPNPHILKIMKSSGLKTKKGHFVLKQAFPQLRYRKQQSSLNKGLPDLLVSLGNKTDTDFNWCAELDRFFQAMNQKVPFSSLNCEDINYLTCSFFSEIYYLAVSIFAAVDYHKLPEFYCRQSFVKKCLPPLP